jgi:hypothetical protein
VANRKAARITFRGDLEVNMIRVIRQPSQPRRSELDGKVETEHVCPAFCVKDNGSPAWNSRHNAVYGYYADYEKTELIKMNALLQAAYQACNPMANDVNLDKKINDIKNRTPWQPSTRPRQ